MIVTSYNVRLFLPQSSNLQEHPHNVTGTDSPEELKLKYTCIRGLNRQQLTWVKPMQQAAGHPFFSGEKPSSFNSELQCRFQNSNF